MLTQTFSAKNLLKLIRSYDIYRFNLGKNEKEVKERVDEIAESILLPTFQFKTFFELTRKGKRVYAPSCIEDVLVLRKINDNLKRLYKLKQNDRNTIVGQIITLLKEPLPKGVIKIDLSQFYESIPRSKIINKLHSDTLLSYYSKNFLVKLFNTSQFENFYGLPRGLCVNSTLSELYMRNFDQIIKQQEGVYYYARYVDDIVIITFQEPEDIKSLVKIELEKLGLLINAGKSGVPISIECRCKKQCICDNNCKCQKTCKCKIDIKKRHTLEYLGYGFGIPDIPKISNSDIKIHLADKKVKRIKTRIVTAFIDYIRNNDFDLLDMRIRFLTGNHRIAHHSQRGNLKAGIYYSYQLLDDKTILNELNLFLRKNIFSKKGKYGSNLNKLLTKDNKNKLKKYSFLAGFENPITHSFSGESVAKIKKCWEL